MYVIILYVCGLGGVFFFVYERCRFPSFSVKACGKEVRLNCRRARRSELTKSSFTVLLLQTQNTKNYINKENNNKQAQDNFRKPNIGKQCTNETQDHDIFLLSSSSARSFSNSLSSLAVLSANKFHVKSNQVILAAWISLTELENTCCIRGP